MKIINIKLYGLYLASMNILICFIGSILTFFTKYDDFNVLSLLLVISIILAVIRLVIETNSYNREYHWKLSSIYAPKWSKYYLIISLIWFMICCYYFNISKNKINNEITYFNETKSKLISFYSMFNLFSSYIFTIYLGYINSIKNKEC